MFAFFHFQLQFLTEDKDGFVGWQAHGLSLSVGNVIVVALTATLAAIGSASIPNSALVSMITVLQVSLISTLFV